MKKYILTAIFLFTVFFAYSQNRPFVLGYASGEQKNTDDSLKVSYSGGAPFATNWQNTTDGFDVLLGFKHNNFYVENAFNKELFVSKGYYSEYVELRWEVEKYETSITGFRIFRKELGSTGDSVMVASLASTERSWRDDYAESNVIYQYTLVALGISQFYQKMMNYVDGVGFRVPYGRVYGRVTYKGGTAVPGVRLIAETEDNFSGHSLKLNGTSSYIAISPPLDDPHFKFNNQFTFQAWFKPNGAGLSCLMEKEGQYKITHTNGQVNFTAGTQTLTLNFTQKVDTFFNVTAIRTKDDSLKLFVIYDYDNYFFIKDELIVATPSNNNEVFIGKSSTGDHFDGTIDEVRIWYRGLNERYALESSSMYIAGTEDSLAVYYRMDENVGNVVYDLSRKGFIFNEKHGYLHNCVWSTQVPFSRQLGVMGLTDKNGNYIISGIPYSTDGSIYRIVPVFGTHTFDPTEKLLYIGPGSSSHSNIDFIDVASFTVTGYVYYNDTRFPVSDVFVKIDGTLAVNSEGSPITTDAAGKFSVDVPIGKHFLNFEKNGHTFENDGRFPPLGIYDDDRFDFQADYSLQDYIWDLTRIKVIGRVVGGPIQAAQPLGMGKSMNNIGNARILLGTQKDFDLIENTTVPLNGIWLNQSYENDELKTKGETNYTIVNTAPKQIEIFPDTETGEFFAYLLPERYIIKSITAGSYTFDASFHTIFDLMSSWEEKTEIDSVIVGQSISGNGIDTINVYRVDSVDFQVKRDFILRVVPSVKVTDKNNNPNFWESVVKAKDGTEVEVIDIEGKPLTKYPIFLQREEYELKIAVFEQFINIDNGNAVDNVPVTDGRVEIQNFLAINESKFLYDINEFGYVNYKFSAGLPNITTEGIGDYLKTMSIVAKTGQNNSIITNWYPGGSGIYDWLPSGVTFRAYVFGGMPTGNNFVTMGPSKIDMILRDPPGSASYSYYEVGRSVSTTSSLDVSHNWSGAESLTILLGTKTSTFAGVGAGVIIEAEQNNDVTVGFEHSKTWLKNNTTTSTFTTTQRWETSSDPDFVGADGDIFIGHSTNIVYGACTFIDLIPESSCVDCVTGDNLAGYNVGVHVGLRVNPEFGTGFIYSQYHIVNYLIPNLIMLRNNILQNGTYYSSVLSIDNKDYGKDNDILITVINDTGTNGTGTSYNFTIPPSWPQGEEFVDSIKHFNKQIKMWEEALARNEREKIEAKLIRNHSFDAGVIYENTVTYDTSKVETSTFEFSISPSISVNIGFTLMKFGFQASITESYEHTRTKSDGTEEVNSVTFGYVLADNDAGDYFSVDVKEPQMQTGPIFYTRGGQSKCPYEGEIFTEYYMPGTIISEATMQREIPQISVENAIVAGVPEDEAAIFRVQLRNISETGDEAWFFLVIDETSNQDGALIKMDGSAIGNGRLVRIPAGQTINKIITLEKTVPSVYEYNDICLILESSCQSEISDSITISASFQPVCTKIDLTQLINQWVVNTNTGTDVLIGINNYNLAHTTFEKIAIQYKPSSSSQWITDMIYYKDEADFNAANDPKEFIDGQTALTYVWRMEYLPDRRYDVRLQTQCSDGTVKNSAVLSGIKDTKRPTVFGTPQPGNGILSPGDDIMVTFNEIIQESLILSSNFSVTGVLNGTDNNHNSCIHFDGTNSYLSNLEGVNLTNKSFTIEFWAKKGIDNANGVIFAQSEIEIGFDASNNFFITLGTETITTATTYLVADDWKHFAVSFDNSTKELYVFIDDQIIIENLHVPTAFDGRGRMFIGKNENSTIFFNGYLHDFRIWERFRGFASVYSQMNKLLTGDEIGLSGLWLMNETYGDYARDYARNHHALLVDANWRVFPTGYACVFDGSSNLTIPTGSTVVISKEMDFTVEFWFNTAPQTNTVMFSNGQGDGTDASPAYLNAWNIGFDNQGYLYFSNNGIKSTVTDQLYTDNKWYHLAVVTNRRGNANIYINGDLKTSEHAVNLGGLVAADMSIGARRNYNAGVTTYDRNFIGSIDEFRIWRLARTSNLISMDMTSKLKGDEIGLVAYYPFDNYDANLVLVASLEDLALDDDTGNPTGLIATSNSTSFDNNNVPNIKQARPVQKIQAFNWVVNNDKIIINLEEDPALIEKCVLTFTVDKIEDLQENRMASPVTWTAFINMNTVVWEENYKEFQKILYQPLNFTVNIENIGGTEQNFQITNLPNWLTVNQSSGTLLPLSQKTITFTVDEFLNIGNYEVSVFLTSNFGYNEKLNVRLKVYQQPPNWTVDVDNYQYSMGVVGQISIDGKFSTNPDDKIAAFVGEECRGVANLQYVRNYDKFEAFLNIYSNVETGENITFKIWNASLGRIHDDVTPNLVFENNSIIGNPANPQIFETTNSLLSEIQLVNGWRWISFNLNSPNLNNVNALFAEIEAVDENIIKGQTIFDVYNIGLGWLGSLSNSGGFTNSNMYMVKLNSNQTLRYSGPKVNVTNIPITLNQGWSWIGFTPDINIAVNDAFANYSPNSGDLIKSQFNFAIYDNNLGWVGTLNFLNPGRGYMYQNTKPATESFYYPEGGFNKMIFEDTQDFYAKVAGITFNPDNFELNASVIAEIIADFEINENHILVAYVDDECRGFIQPINYESKKLYFLTIYANITNETFNFKLYNSEHLTFDDFNEFIVFEPNSVVGNLATPFELTLTNSVNISETYGGFKFDVMPNPSEGLFNIKFSNYNKIESDEDNFKLQISDLTGRVLYETNVISDNVLVDFSNKASGVYMVKVYFNGRIYTNLIVKK
jgi:hypothetical protein